MLTCQNIPPVALGCCYTWYLPW